MKEENTKYKNTVCISIFFGILILCNAIVNLLNITHHTDPTPKPNSKPNSKPNLKSNPNHKPNSNP